MFVIHLGENVLISGRIATQSESVTVGLGLCPFGRVGLAIHLTLLLLFLSFSVPNTSRPFCFSFSDNGTCGSNKGGCDQICVQTDGGYYCQCEAGYVTDPAHPRKCIGKSSNTLH